MKRARAHSTWAHNGHTSSTQRAHIGHTWAHIEHTRAHIEHTGHTSGTHWAHNRHTLGTHRAHNTRHSTTATTTMLMDNGADHGGVGCLMAPS